jgi:hypothetical protein
MGTTTRTPAVPGVLQDPVSNRGVVLVVLVAWFGAELITGGRQAGLADRDGLQSAWNQKERGRSLLACLTGGPRAADPAYSW